MNYEEYVHDDPQIQAAAPPPATGARALPQGAPMHDIMAALVNAINRQSDMILHRTRTDVSQGREDTTSPEKTSKPKEKQGNPSKLRSSRGKTGTKFLEEAHPEKGNSPTTLAATLASWGRKSSRTPLQKN
ncbi:hypothetical protein L195_g046905 [Trifolium pratense]|uniref:Uncharacterized protein n=1 Tax=Trifolium pratense TaxID=57577 RepID=A0A2K3MJ13_TRIPR|nr:hypothetical protein L195_g046905 [Trifolium pratense]